MHRLGAYKNSSSVNIIQGYFNDTLPTAGVGKIALLRLDGDVFTSTWDALVNFYDKVVPGGYIYIDDYDSFNGCKHAVDTYREKYDVTEPMIRILEGKRKDQRMKLATEAVWWKKQR